MANQFSDFYNSLDTDPARRSKQFEHFVKWFLKADPEWATQVDQIWLWEEWPERWGADCGIDLVFQHRNGEHWAVQAKCYSPDYDITKHDVDKFLSESNRPGIKHRLLIATTDRIGGNAKQVCEAQEKPVVRFLLSDFERSALDYPANLAALSQETEPGVTAEGPYKQLGVDLRLDVRWLSKTYNKLGSFLHAEFPYAPAGAFADTNKVRTELRAVIEKIRPFVEKTFTWTVAEIIFFECVACNELVLANKKGVDATGYATCHNPGCGVRYLVKGKWGEDFELEPESCSVDCPECGGQILFPAHMLSADYKFSCSGCHCRYQVAHKWAYVKIMET